MNRSTQFPPFSSLAGHPGHPFLGEEVQPRLREVRTVMALRADLPVGDLNQIAADLYTFDLEDGVAQARRAQARAEIRAHLDGGSFDAVPLAIRINAASQAAEVDEDLRCVAHAAVDALILPMVRHREDVQWFANMSARAWSAAGLEARLPVLIPVIETLAAVEQAASILRASPRVGLGVFGIADFAVDADVDERSELALYARRHVALVGRAAGLGMIDAPCFALDDPELLARECAWARSAGYTAKLALTPRHIPVLRRCFGIQESERRSASSVVDASQEGRTLVAGVNGRVFVGPPHLARAHKLLRTTDSLDAESATPVTLVRDAPRRDKTRRRVIGQLVEIPGDLTFDAAAAERWSASFFNVNRLENSAAAARHLGLRDRLLPLKLVLATGVGLSVPYLSEHGRFHLAFGDVVLCRPVYAGDTLRSVFYVRSVRPTRSGSDEVVESVHALLDPDGEVVLRATKRTLFARATGPSAWALDEQALRANEDRIIASASLGTQIVARIARQAPEQRLSFDPQPPLRPGDTFVHRFVKVFGEEESRSLSNLLRATNAHHYDRRRFTPTELVVAGPCVVAAALSNTLDDLGDRLTEELIHCSNINRVNLDAMIGTVSHILAVSPCADDDDLEEVTLQCLGIKDLDVTALAGRAIPTELLSADELRPRALEELCRRAFPAWSHRIACQAVWRFIRPRPAR